MWRMGKSHPRWHHARHRPIHVKHQNTTLEGRLKGFTLFIGPSLDQEAWPVRAILQYLFLNSNHDMPSCSPTATEQHYWLKQDISKEIRNLLLLCGVACATEHATHSLQIGAATTAAIAGVPEHLIHHMGRWKSNVASKYIRVSTVDFLNSLLN